MDLLFGAAQTGEGGGGIAAFLPFIIIMGIIYFLMIRPQAKKQKEKSSMMEDLKKGDKVVTVGGIYGSVSGFKEKGRIVILNVDKSTNLTVNKSSISGLAEKVTSTDLESQN
ncbi:MAG: preprotein translocase subunit YajC [Candidatus Marinimicrobia bacterium]|jgi:preprotein translocase subunit YajC|nr:preprotein translocase subunit YajC [Candidatus Neomarinimicrobiota bacterium]MBT3496878.1 preprotein translocase subunit YajC [Candidatus Neomarinimicrobiota bacterium]MBT3692290.1 preprotein translocase subunit YajC [Candidatus Neomarinimicrobiota bacterium]MBT3732132.1 preprotein translocase subunit YajC [Candidatus Neomarinimicrobiota bacterium]MBT4144149.1 preprotein translocase subunit YajC [Candidatus Neomarinimicrobiota bacterium]